MYMVVRKKIVIEGLLLFVRIFVFFRFFDTVLRHLEKDNIDQNVGVWFLVACGTAVACETVACYFIDVLF